MRFGTVGFSAAGEGPCPRKAAGACALCPKPLPGDELVRAVRSLLAERSVCLACWETGAPFRQVSFGGARSSWLRHEPLAPDVDKTS